MPEGGCFDVVLGADLVWSQETAVNFALVLRAVILSGGRQNGPPPTVIYGHWNRSPKWHRFFLEQCAVQGIVATSLLDAADDGNTAARQEESHDDLVSKLASSVAAAAEDEEVDWGGCMFGDSGAYDGPIFFVYRLTLQE
mmetsp:Transcript_48300/g.138720  ORF Transcript_48300/g.138720 Transcript_48300/m.138720 type:complete len:140 (+) Transcript_48300:3-422(+)